MHWVSKVDNPGQEIGDISAKQTLSIKCYSVFEKIIFSSPSPLSILKHALWTLSRDYNIGKGGDKKWNMGSGDQIIPVLKENVLGSVSTTFVIVYSFKAERQLKSIKNFTCALHE